MRALDRRDAPAQPADGRRERPLRRGDRRARGRQRERLGLSVPVWANEAVSDRERAPREREPEVGVDRAAEQLEVVRHTRNTPAPMNAQIHGETSSAPSMPSATAPASPTTASAHSTPSGMRVPSGRPCNSSSACAATPIARKNAIDRLDQPPDVHASARCTRPSPRTTGARACTAGAAASSSRATRRGSARRTRDVRRSSPSEDTRSALHRPDDDAGAERHDARPHVAHPAACHHRTCSGERGALVERARCSGRGTGRCGATPARRRRRRPA